MEFTIDAIVASKIGFASHQNATPLVRELKLRLDGDRPTEHCQLTLVAEPSFVQPKTWRIERILPGDELVIADRNIQLHATLLSGLTESLIGSISLTLNGADGAELASSSYPIELLAHNEWGGLSTMAELLPAFVMPNDPAVDLVLGAASDALRRAGKPSELDGYKSKDRRRIWQVASAIWSAIAGLRLSYALPPSSFERNGQKVRTPSRILEGRIATCLDTALLFAAALEQAGLNPLLILTRGHAFAGVWLQPVEFASLLTDEAAALRRRFDLDDLLLFETTLVTNDPPAGFTQAIASARRHIAEDADDAFEMTIDVRRARIQRIRPLGVAIAAGEGATTVATTAEGLEEAPRLPAFDVEIEDVVVTSSDRVRQWQRKLLNLTTANRLLHLPDGPKTLRLLCPDPGALEDLLASGRKVKIAALPDLGAGGRDEALYEGQTQESLREQVARQTLERGEALSVLTKDRLDAALTELYRKARTDLEEGGANTLFLALGFLKWKKSATEEKSYRAPLILLPVSLERRSAISGVVMLRHEDEARFNLTLLELLRQDYQLSVPELEGDLPKDDQGIDVAGIWRTIRAAVRDMPGFEVVPDVVLGTFSFAKYLMWKDLVDRADRLKESPLVRHLIDRDGGAFGERGRFPRPEDLDAEVDPAELFTPLPADSSQLAAIVASARGHTFVLDGPPGCGKSQTIANIIAHNLALGRRILFVAEKRAALDVVHRRLADKGLAPFCLELHSAKATKTTVLRQLDQAWTVRETLTGEAWEREAAEIRVLRDELNALVRLLHRREPNGWTIHDAIGRVVRDGDEHAPRLTFAPDARHDGADMDRFRDLARRLGLARADVGDLPPELDDVAATAWSNAWQENVVAAANSVTVALEALEHSAERVHAATSLPRVAGNRATLARRLELMCVLLEMHGQNTRLAFSASMQDQMLAARDGLALLELYRAEEGSLSARYTQQAVRGVDISAMRAAWTDACNRLWPLASLEKRKVARRLAHAGGVAGPVDPEADLPRLSAMQGLIERIDALGPRLAGIPGWAGLATRSSDVEAALARAERLRAAIAAEADGPESLVALRSAVAALVIDANELLAGDGPVAGAALRLKQALDACDLAAGRFGELVGAPDDPDVAGLRRRATAVTANARRLRDWTNWRRVREEAADAGLAPLVEALETGRASADQTVRTFELAYAYWFAFTRMDEEPLLKAFAANAQMDRIERFRALDDRMSSLASRYIRAKVCGLIPDKADVTRKDGYGILRHQLQLQRAHKPIRQLATDMGEAFTRLAPCMLMSPLSIAQYLPADQALFDLVIFDEASQITPWDAIGAMARGRQVVIAGDPRQMPPSNDFQRVAGGAADDTGEETERDLDSILEECLGAGVPQHSLDWHYRSRHESLIAFSNHRYYNNRLVTFPAPETRASAVSWRRTPGVWARGAERTNPIEARAIVDEAVRRLRDPAFVDASGRPLSLGIITMNLEQMRLIEDLLDRARRAHPELEPHFAEDKLEPVVVRNLETAQGDERDVILIGVGFGPTEPGGNSMSMHFGKLNTQGGWRRLNVAVTRARAEMQLFTSFDPGMIDLKRTIQPAIADLKQFIEYADRGPRAIAQADRGSLGGPESPFEEAVALELRRRGWTVAPQVGVSRFRIDLGVVHPDRPGDYLLGIECDGAAYHSAATARDRDKVRAAILEGLGWRLLRVWSTDWWTDRQRAAERLHAAIQAALEQDRASRTAVEATHAGEETRAPSVEASELEAVAPDPFEMAPRNQDYVEEEPRGPAIAGGPPNRAGDPDLYHLTDFSGLDVAIDPSRFYEPSYDETLAKVVAHVLAAEAPIAEPHLVQRVARAHGFQRAGRVIRDRVMQIVQRRHHVASDGGGPPFAWMDADGPTAGIKARFPASEEHIRQIEDIAIAELAAAGSNDPVEIARRFGIRRLSAAARARIELALSQDRGVGRVSAQ
jgi:very-short-patch-repair endonuclease